jgi:hypothetical protein
LLVQPVAKTAPGALARSERVARKSAAAGAVTDGGVALPYEGVAAGDPARDWETARTTKRAERSRARERVAGRILILL